MSLTEKPEKGLACWNMSAPGLGEDQRDVGGASAPQDPYTLRSVLHLRSDTATDFAENHGFRGYSQLRRGLFGDCLPEQPFCSSSCLPLDTRRTRDAAVEGDAGSAGAQDAVVDPDA